LFLFASSWCESGCVCGLFTAIASGSFERVCVLFNIAAMQSQIAETQNIGSDDGRKIAAKLFQVFVATVLIAAFPLFSTWVEVIFRKHHFFVKHCV